MIKIAKGLIASLFFTSMASANEVEYRNLKIECYSEEFLFAELMGKYKELPILFGGLPHDSQMTFWVNVEGTFSFVITETDGKACLVASGVDIFAPSEFFPLAQSLVSH